MSWNPFTGWAKKSATGPAVKYAQAAATGEKKPGEKAAEFAIECAEDPAKPDYKDLSAKMCWDAVIWCAYKSKAITKQAYGKMENKINSTNYSAFIKKTDPLVEDAAAMRKVPKGSFLGSLKNPLTN